MPSTQDTSPNLSSEQLAAYDRDGFLILPGFYTPQEMLEWKLIAKELVAQQNHPSETGVALWSGPALHPVLKAAMRHTAISSILTRIIGPNLEFLSVKAVFKDGGTSFASPWHQDWFYWKGSTKISVWIALDDATPGNGCLKFIPGTHKTLFDCVNVGGNAFPRRLDDKDLEGLPVRTINVKRGDIVVFHDLAVHSSYPNTSGAERWSLISTYRNAADRDPTTLNEGLWSRPLLIAGHSVNGGETF